jgi:hypothetical protein
MTSQPLKPCPLNSLAKRGKGKMRKRDKIRLLQNK